MLNLPEDLPAPATVTTDLNQVVADAREGVPVTTLFADVRPLAKEAKAGYKTTEFWLTIGTVLLTQLGALHLPGKYGATVATAAAVASYAVSRGVAKAGVPHPD